MSTVVPTSEEDAALSVVRFASELAWADAGPEVAEPQVSRLCLEAEEFIAMGKWLELASLMITSAELIFSKVSEKDVESIFTIICNLVTKTENPDEVMEIVKVITAKLVQQPTEKPAVRLKILIILYNLLETPYCQFYVYMKALNLAVDGKVTEYIIPSFKKIDSFLKEWKIGTPEQRELFLTISNVLKENKSMSKDSFKFLTNHLVSFSGEEAHVLSEAKEEAVRAVVDFVKAPDVFQVNDDEVELWVFKAITAKLIDCKMDQMNQVVLVSHHTDRVFGQHQWQTLRTKLVTWRGNISNVISIIQANKVSEDESQAAQGLVVH